MAGNWDFGPTSSDYARLSQGERTLRGKGRAAHDRERCHNEHNRAGFRALQLDHLVRGRSLKRSLSELSEEDHAGEVATSTSK